MDLRCACELRCACRHYERMRIVVGHGYCTVRCIIVANSLACVENRWRRSVK